MSTLKQRIIDRSVTWGSWGWGTSAARSREGQGGLTVIGFDIQKEKVDMVNRGHNYIGDVVSPIWKRSSKAAI